MTSSADPNCDVAQPHSKISTGNVIQQVNQRESTENNGIADQDLGESESDLDQDNASVDALSSLGTEAIEKLASGLNKAANTIEGYSQNTIDEENLKQLNDEQLLRLLEEAYHSKKLDEKNKSAIFKEILEDVHESLATPDNTDTTKSASATVQSKTTNSAQSSNFNSKSNQQTKNNQHSAGRKSSCKNAAKYDSIAALTDIMDYSSTNITIPASGSALVQKSDRDPDADTSSTKTEVEEMELDQLSDLEDNLRAHENARNWDENGNPPSTSTNNSSGSSVSFTARQLKPLSIYRHNPAFHSQHVSVNQCDEIPPLSPTALQPNNSLNSTTEGQENSDRMLPAKVRRKKKAVKTEGLIKAEEIDGYRGGEDLESLLQFIEAKPKSSTNPDSNGIGTGNGLAPQQTEKGSGNSSKSKRSRRTDHKSKRSRTPSVTTPSQEKSPDTSQSQKTSRASSISVSATNIAPSSVENGVFGSGNGLTENNSDNNQAPDSVTTVKNSLIIPNNAVTSSSNNKKSGTLKKPKKQAGWLVDFNNDIGTGKNRVKSKPPSGSKNMQEAEMKNQKESETPEKSCEIISNNTNEDSSDEAEPISIQDEIIMTPPFDENSGQPEEEFNPEAVVEMESSQNNQFNKLSSQKNIEEQDDVCFNYASILKFIKQEWDIVTMEISNGSNDIQSKVVYYRPREKI